MRAPHALRPVPPGGGAGRVPGSLDARGRFRLSWWRSSGESLMMTERIDQGLTFDDVLLVPARSEVHPTEVDLPTRLTRHIRLNIPLLSAAMDTVTEWRTAICMAQEGGIGIIHKNMTPEEQAMQVDLVKRSESGMITHPITIAPEAEGSEALKLMEKYRIL